MSTNNRPRRHRPLLTATALLAGLALLGACQGEPAPTPPPLPPTRVSAVPEPAGDPAVTVTGYTHLRPDGNRLVAGQGQIDRAAPIDIPLNGTPQWVVAVPGAGGGLWAVVLTDGTVQAFAVGSDGTVTPVAVTPDQVPPGTPPILQWDGGAARLLLAAGSGATHPVPVAAGGLAWTELAGSLRLRQGDRLTEIAIDPLPDGRLLQDERGRLLLLTAPTDRYGHGVLGDRIEGGAVTLIDSADGSVVTTIPIDAPFVVEGIAPIWADLNGDGSREIILTRSSAATGAQIVVYNEAGERVATGPAIGRGNRWRHQLAVAPFGPNGELELVDVLTPHLGGVVEFFQWRGDELVVVASQSGYTSHVIGTRNLDMAAGGDFDGDGRVELLLPDQERRLLGAVRRVGAGAEVVWTQPAGGTISTNVAAITLAGDVIWVGVGREDGVLRLWGGPN